MAAKQVLWRAVRQPSGTVDGDLIDVTPATDSINRFATGATLVFDDPDGDKLADYPRGQRIDLEVSTDGGSTFNRRFAGSAQDRTEASDGGADRLDVEMVGNDHFLRLRTVQESFSSTKLSSILETVVKDYTPIDWDSGNSVTVQNDKTVSWDVNGQKADRVIDRVAAASADEDYGVDDRLNFFFEQQETVRAGSDILDGDWFDYNLPEKGSEGINRVDLFYGPSGSRDRVVVEDRAEQRDLADKLGVSGNVVIAKEVTFERISDDDHAEATARSILAEQSAVRTGTVTTYGRFDMDPGDVFRLQISEKGIDTDFRVAQIEYNWSDNTTVVTVAEAVGDVEDLLVQLADDVRKVDLRAADFSAAFTRFLDLRSGVTLETVPGFTEIQLDADAFEFGLDPGTSSAFGFGNSDALGFRQESVDFNGIVLDTYPDARLIFGLGGGSSSQSALGFGAGSSSELGLSGLKSSTNVSLNSEAVTTAYLNACRDLWQGESAAPGISHFAVGTGTESAVSTDTDLGSEAHRDTGTEDEQAVKTAEYQGRMTPAGTATNGGLTEFGFFDAASGGTMYLSGTTDSFDPSRRDLIRARVTVTVADDSELFGVITDTGQEDLIDWLLGTTPDAADTMLFGTGTTDPATGDTSLGNQVHTESIATLEDRSRGITGIIADTIGTGEANNNDLSEVGYENTADQFLAHAVFEAFSKSSDFDVDTDYRFRARNA